MLRKFVYFAEIIFLVILAALMFNVNSVDAIDVEPPVGSYPDNYDYYDDDDDDDDESHNAGQNCLGCHSFKLAGTVYTNSVGSAPVAGATVEVTSSSGKVTMTTDWLGNFRSKTSFSGAYSVTITHGTNRVSMASAQSYGGCNISSCHSAGSSSGRIYINNSFDISKGTLTGYVYSDSAAATSLSYNSDIKSILDTRCIICHKAGGTRSVTPLTTYSETLNALSPGNANSLIITQTATGGSMAPYLTGDEALKIKNWTVDYSAAEASTGASGVVVGALVTVGTTSVTTGADGSFTFSGIAVGVKTITVTATAYDQSSGQITIEGGKTVTLNVTLTLTDIIPPAKHSIIIANGETTDEVGLTLTLYAEDNIGVTGYYASENPTPPLAIASGWIPVASEVIYAKEVPFVIGTEQGTKTVYVWFKDSEGNMSNPVVSDSIMSFYVPTLSEWGIIFLVGLLLTFSVLHLNSRKES